MWVGMIQPDEGLKSETDFPEKLCIKTTTFLFTSPTDCELASSTITEANSLKLISLSLIK